MPFLLVIFFAFFLQINLYANVYSGNINESIDTNFTTGINSSFSNTVRNQKVNFDNNQSTTIDKNVTGFTQYKDFNISSPTSVQKLMQHITNLSAGSAQGIIKRMGEKNPDMKTFTATNINKASIDKVTNIYQNDDRIKSVQNTKNTITNLLNVFGTRDTIKCYIKRKLIPSFFCPLNGKNHSYFTGGTANTPLENSKKECDNFCKIPRTCLSKQIPHFSSIENHNISKSVPFMKTYSLSKKQELKTVTLILHGKANRHVNISIFANMDGKETVILNNYDALVSPSKKSISFSANLYGALSIKIVLEQPYIKAELSNNIIVDKSLNAIMLDSISLNYASNKYWFCPVRQIVTKKSECVNGRIVSIVIGGAPVLLCISPSDARRESQYGAYFDESSCNNECYESSQCSPTYKNLGNENLISSIYNVSYGCLSGSDNDSCTKDLCKQKIFNNVFPNKEVVYYNDDAKETTVLSGQAVEGKTRPIYDISAEMSTNGNTIKKKELMVSMNKDKAYRYMMTNKTFIISDYPISHNYPIQTKATKIGSSGVAIEYVPDSNLFDNHKQTYIYVITKNIYSYENKETQEEIFNGVTTSNTFKSYTYTVINSSGKPRLFYIVDKDKVYNKLNQNYDNYVDKEKMLKMVGTNGELLDYDAINTIAPVTVKKTLTSSNYRLHYLLSNAYLPKLSSTDGTFLRNQIESNGKIKQIFSGVSGKDGGLLSDYVVYIIASKAQLSYKDLVDKINNGALHKAYQYASSSRLTSKIVGDASLNFNGDNIRLFLLGNKNNLTAMGEFKPEFGEEGKNAFIFNFLYKEKAK